MNATSILTDLLFDETDVVFDAVCNVAENGCEKHPLCTRPCRARDAKDVVPHNERWSGSIQTEASTCVSSTSSSVSDVGQRMAGRSNRRGTARSPPSRRPVAVYSSSKEHRLRWVNAERVLEREVAAWSARDSNKIPAMITVERDVSECAIDSNRDVPANLRSVSVNESSSNSSSSPYSRKQQQILASRLRQRHRGECSVSTGSKPSSIDIYNVIVSAVRRNRFSVVSEDGATNTSSGKRSSKHTSKRSSSQTLDLAKLVRMDPSAKIKIKNSPKRLKLVANSSRSPSSPQGGQRTGRATDLRVVLQIGRCTRHARYSGEVLHLNNGMQSHHPDDESSGPSASIPHGMGVLRFDNGDFYIGEMKYGRMEGRGSLMLADKSMAKGRFKNNRFLG